MASANKNKSPGDFIVALFHNALAFRFLADLGISLTGAFRSGCSISAGCWSFAMMSRYGWASRLVAARNAACGKPSRGDQLSACLFGIVNTIEFRVRAMPLQRTEALATAGRRLDGFPRKSSPRQSLDQGAFLRTSNSSQSRRCGPHAGIWVNLRSWRSATPDKAAVVAHPASIAS